MDLAKSSSQRDNVQRLKMPSTKKKTLYIVLNWVGFLIISLLKFELDTNFQDLSKKSTANTF